MKKNDGIHGKRLEKALQEFIRKEHISGATVWFGVDGFVKSGKPTVQLEG